MSRSGMRGRCGTVLHHTLADRRGSCGVVPDARTELGPRLGVRMTTLHMDVKGEINVAEGLFLDDAGRRFDLGLFNTSE